VEVLGIHLLSTQERCRFGIRGVPTIGAFISKNDRT
jgi:hypothetical protein